MSEVFGALCHVLSSPEPQAIDGHARIPYRDVASYQTILEGLNEEDRRVFCWEASFFSLPEGFRLVPRSVGEILGPFLTDVDRQHGADMT